MSRRDINERNQAALEAYRADACAEVDALFDDRALEQQRHKILAKLANLGNPAKVIRFPNPPQVEVAPVNVNRRWITVAAAAGLIVGLLGGQLVHLVPNQRRLPPMATSIAPSAPTAQPHFMPVKAQADDELLGEIEMAMQQRVPKALRALDDFTPLAGPR